jgi:hypothetical protein
MVTLSQTIAPAPIRTREPMVTSPQIVAPGLTVTWLPRTVRVMLVR